ncbi:MAG: MoxR family ATPase [Pseudomonadota bacterium]
MSTTETEALNADVARFGPLLTRLMTAMSEVIVGQRDMLSRLLIGMFANGHILLEGVPGLAKTRAMAALAQATGADYQRIQFTPDLLPADLIGTQIFQPQTSDFRVRRGPVFANIVLADEINRAPAKVQSALLEAMQEHQVTIGEESLALPEPFMVLATMNPLEQDGTFPLPEAQMDRFMLKLSVDYPSKEEELEILNRMAHTGPEEPIAPVISANDIIEARQTVDRILIDDKIKRYIVDLVFATRDPKEVGLDIGQFIDYGASPRATIYLTLVAKAHAFINGRGYVLPDDVKAMGMDVLRHRVLVNYEAEAEGLGSEQIIGQIFDALPVP